MSIEAAFLADIRAHPEDDAPRLIYADWLDDQGEADRAEFIRVQCELAQPGLANRRRVALEQREQQLWEAHDKAWTESLEREYRLGLPGNGLTDESARLLADCPSLFLLAELNLNENQITDMGARALAESPYLQHLAELSIYSNPLSEAGKQALRRRFDQVFCE